jgi:integrase
MKMAREKYYQTGIQRFFYKYNKAKQKVYVAKFEYNKKSYKRVLTSNKEESLKMLKDLVAKIKDENKKQDLTNRSKFFVEKMNNAINPLNYTLNELFKEYMHVDGKKLAIKEQSSRISRYNNWIAPVLGKMKFINIKYKHIQTLINNIDEADLLNRKTQDHLKNLCSAIFRYAIKMEYYDKTNPATFVEILPYDNHRNLPIDILGVEKLFKAILDIEKQQYRVMFLFMMHGRRLNEMLHIEYKDIDFINNVHVIPAHKSKTKKTQMHMMTTLLQTELKSYIETNNIEKGYIFINPDTDKPYVDLSRFFTRLKIKADITLEFQMTDFRHIIGTLVRKICKLPLADARDALGHGSIKTTEKFYEDRYSETSKHTVQAVFDAVGV